MDTTILIQMNAFRIFYLITITLLATFAISCSSSDEPIDDSSQTEKRMIPVSIGFSGEIINIIDTPLSKADDTKNWYAFQVYSAPADGSSDYTHYAYGFFDSKENMIINLKEGYKYKFDVNMVVDGESKVHSFALTHAGWTRPSNSFYISSYEYVRYMYDGYLYLNIPHDQFNRPNVDRFFGRTIDFIPEEGKAVSINMKRVSFGAKFVAKDFIEGNIEINVEGAPSINLDIANGNEIQDMVSFKYLEDAYRSSEEYYEEIPVNIIWVKPGNVRVPIASENVRFKRNKLTTIEFMAKESTTSNSFDLTASEELGSGDIITIGGDGTNTDVEPNV